MRFVIQLQLVAALCVSSLFAAEEAEFTPPTPGTYVLPVIKQATGGNVLDTDDRPLDLAELTRRKITVLSFIYTRCAARKACPYATGVLNQLHRFSLDDATLAKELRLISLSFDPANDTPGRMADWSDWARKRDGAAEWKFLTTKSTAELQPILDGYGQAVNRKRNPTDPAGPLNHILRVFLIDSQGRIRNIYGADTLDETLVMADIRTLQLESKKGPHLGDITLSH